MVPHSLFVSSDRHVDVALKLLSLLIGGALLATAGYLAFLSLRPVTPADRGDVGPPAWASMSEALLTSPRLEFDFTLPYGPRIYRCEEHGHVTYADRPCANGRVRSLSLRPS
jgi:hypothetical protein